MISIARAMRDEAGQSMVLASLSIFVLALVVTMTVQIGFGIHQRIQLQNASDASAYSQAVLVARSLNYIAFVNRAAIVHYCAALALHSIPSVFSAFVAATGMFRDILYTFTSALCSVCTALEKSVYLASLGALCSGVVDVLVAVCRVLDATMSALKQAELVLCEIVAPLVPLFQELNQDLLFWSQKTVRAATELALGGAAAPGDGFGSRVARDTLKGAEPSVALGTGAAALNAMAYVEVFDGGAESFSGRNLYGGSNTFMESGPIERQAQRVITELTNATRSGIGVPAETPITHRSISELDSTGLAGWVRGLVRVSHHGQSKFTNPVSKSEFLDQGSSGRSTNPAFNTAGADSQLSQGISLLAAEHVKVNLGDASSLPGAAALGSQLPSVAGGDVIVGIQAAASTVVGGDAPNRPSFHCKYGSEGRDDGFTEVQSPPCVSIHLIKGATCDEQDRHPWPGMANYLGFRADSKANDDFNQPSFYAAWRLSPDCASLNVVSASGQCAPTLPFGFGTGTTLAHGKVGDGAPLGGGLHSVSVAQVYYHRPGSVDFSAAGQSRWTDPPNLFNPFWRARLAPVADKVGKGLLSSSGIAKTLSLESSTFQEVPFAPALVVMH